MSGSPPAPAPSWPGGLSISRREYGWVLGWSLVVLGLTTVPYAWCALQATPEHPFSGLVYDVEDVRTYLAEMRQGASGAWLLHLPYTSEDHPRAFVHGLYLLLGKLLPLAGGDVLILFHAARVILGVAALVSVYRFQAAFSGLLAVRKVAWLLTAFSSGMGWLLILLGRSQWLGDMPVDFWVPEAFTLPVVYAFPHISLSLLLLLEGLLAYLRAAEGGEKGQALFGGALVLALAFVVPFDLGIAYGAMGAHLVALALLRRDRLQTAFPAALVVGAASLPGLAYNGWVFTRNEAFREWSRQNLGFSPHPAHFAVAYSLLILLAIPGVVRLLRQRRPRDVFLLGWMGAAALLLYLPFNLQRRLILGTHPILCLLAAVGLLRGILPWAIRSRPWRWLLARGRGRYTSRGLRHWATYAVLCLTLPSNLLLLAGPVVQAQGHIPPLYLTREEADAAQWLAEHAQPGSVVLSSPAVGNVLPTVAPVWVFLGHGAITAQFQRKVAEAAWFYAHAAEEPDAARAWLEAQGIRYVYLGPDEQALAGGQGAALEPLPYLELAFQSGGTRIFAFRP
ncbi:MAG: hypothetical protein ACUVST_04755 [Anaerolineae bacterium]